MTDGAAGATDTREGATIGFVGLGQMGAPMASHLAGRSPELVVHDLDAHAVTRLTDLGATAATSLAELGATCEVVSVMVRDDEQVRAVAAEVAPNLRPGAVLAVHSTIRPDTAVELAASWPQLAVVDAPVSGGPIGAHAGRLAVMVGGERSAYDRCKEAFAPWAELVVHVGPVGAGTKTKLARNLVNFAGFAVALEAARLAEAAGIELRTLAEVVRHSDALTGGAGVILLRDTTAPVDPSDPLHAILANTLSLGDKDLSLALELGDSLGVDLPFARLARERLGVALGLAAEEN